jgi:hypothetical protein
MYIVVGGRRRSVDGSFGGYEMERGLMVVPELLHIPDKAKPQKRRRYYDTLVRAMRDCGRPM